MSTEVQQTLLDQQLQELIKVGVGGKFRDTNDYIKKVEEELKFEEQMMRGGIDRYQKHVRDAQTKGQESTTMYGLYTQQKYIGKLSHLIHLKVQKVDTGQVGVHQVAIKKVSQCLPKSAFYQDTLKLRDDQTIWDTCSLIVLKNVIDGISNESTLNNISILIGSALMMEARILMFKEQKKDQYNQVFKKLAGKNIPQKANRWQYKKNVWVYCMNKHELQFDDWSKEHRLHLGIEMVHLCQLLGLVKVGLMKTAKKHSIKYVQPTPKIIKEIKNFNIKNEALYPKYLPMLMPPRDWDNPFVGGYYGRKHNFENKPQEIANALQSSKSNK